MQKQFGTGTGSGICSYLEEYAENIYARLKEIDVFIKSSEKEIDIRDVSGLLDISVGEVREIMCEKNFKKVNRENFCGIMEAGSSRLCRMYKRELETGAPPIYTRENISYIYDIELDKVNKACEMLNLKEVTWYMLPSLFANITAEA